MSSSSKALQWLSLVGIIWLQSINGTNTTFPAYSSQLKTILSMSQLEVNNLVFASDAGKLLGWISGIAALYLPLWLVLIIGSFLGLIGYGVQFLFITNQIAAPAYWQIFFLTVVAGNSICWINTVCYVVSIRNFPFHQQVAVGLTTSYQGLSAKIYTDIVNAVFLSSPNQRAKAYLLLNSLLPLLACVIVAPLVRQIDVGTGEPRNMAAGFNSMFVITIATGIYAVISSLGSTSIGLTPLHSAIGTGVFLLLPLVIPSVEKLREEWRRWYINRENRVYNFTTDESVENGVVKEKEEEEQATRVVIHNEVGEIQVQHGVGVKEEIGVKLMIQRIDFWLYFLVYFFSATIGLVFLNTLGQIAESRGSSKTSSLVSLSSSFGFFGRLMPSLLDYFFSRNKYMISRPALLMVLAAPIAGVFFLLLNPANVSLIISTSIIGVCSGAITSIAVSITTELFGTKNFSVNHNVVVANISIGSFLFGYFSAVLYHKEGNAAGQCMGMACYRSTFIIWGSLCTLGTFLALMLYARTRKFYSQRS